MRKKFLFSVVIVFVISACSSTEKKEYTNQQGQKVVEEWFTGTDLKSRIIFNSSDSSDYLFCSYYENGELEDSVRYVNHQFEGGRLYFDQANGLRHSETYSNGIMNGAHKAVYKNDITSFEGYWINGNKVGEWQFHYPDGRPITYEFYDSVGRVLYFRKYDDKGEVKDVKGSAIIGVSSRTDLKPGAVVMNLIVANPPGSEILIKVLDESSDILCDKKVDAVYTSCSFVLPETEIKHVKIQLHVLDIKSDHIETYEQNFKIIK